MSAPTDRRRQWRFAANDEGQWTWTSSDADGREETSRAFATLKECTADATEHGYVAWKTEDERRRELQLNVAKILLRNDGQNE